MDTVKVDVKSAEQASRIELFIRIVWGVISYIVLGILSIITVYILVPLQWLHILILGKRNGFLASWIKKWFVYAAQLGAYLTMLTDERNPIIPEM